MMKLLKRSLNVAKPEAGEENQVTGFLGEVLPKNAQLWSKAGWTSKVRHDAAYIEIPNKQPYLLTVFTEGQENESILKFYLLFPRLLPTFLLRIVKRRSPDF